MEEILIYKVQERRELYDSKFHGYNDLKFRCQLWNQIAAEIGISAAKCRGMWYKLVKIFSIVLRKRQLNNDQVPSPPKWKYEEQMSFLIPQMVGMDRERLDKLSVTNEDVGSPPEDDNNYTIVETIVDTTAEIDENTVNNNSKNECTALHKPSTSEVSNEELTSNINSAVEQVNTLKPKNYQKISVVDLNSLRNNVKMNKEAPQAAKIDLTASSNSKEELLDHTKVTKDVRISTLKRRNNEPTAYSYLTLEIKANTSKRNESYDNTKEDEFYLRMAKMAKTLTKADRMKLRETVANVVIQAMLQSQK